MHYTQMGSSSLQYLKIMLFILFINNNNNNKTFYLNYTSLKVTVQQDKKNNYTVRTKYTSLK